MGPSRVLYKPQTGVKIADSKGVGRLLKRITTESRRYAKGGCTQAFNFTLYMTVYVCKPGSRSRQYQLRIIILNPSLWRGNKPWLHSRIALHLAVKKACKDCLVVDILQTYEIWRLSFMSSRSTILDYGRGQCKSRSSRKPPVNPVPAVAGKSFQSDVKANLPLSSWTINSLMRTHWSSSKTVRPLPRPTRPSATVRSSFSPIWCQAPAAAGMWFWTR